jgi:hypothetical protein
MVVTNSRRVKKIKPQLEHSGFMFPFDGVLIGTPALIYPNIQIGTICIGLF